MIKKILAVLLIVFTAAPVSFAADNKAKPKNEQTTSKGTQKDNPDKNKDKEAAEQPEEEAQRHPLLDAVSPGHLSMAKNMLDRVEKITLIDTLHVDSADFFTNYFLSYDCGELLDGEALPAELQPASPRVVYRTQDGREIFWSQPVNSSLVIMTGNILDDHSVSDVRPVGDALNDGGGDSDYPFVMQDGLTIYFANNGANSLGGYDIFMTRRAADGSVLQPQNIGMPFNSPYNDFMMVIDESRNLGWWASDREQIPGKVTIYVFEPSSMRVNHPSDTPDIEDLALLNGVVPVGALNTRLVDQVKIKPVVVSQFNIPIGDTVYTSVEQLTNPQAQQAASELISLQDEMTSATERLVTLRSRFAAGDTSVSSEIRRLEKRKLQLPSEIQRITNKVISLERHISR